MEKLSALPCKSLSVRIPSSEFRESILELAKGFEPLTL